MLPTARPARHETSAPVRGGEAPLRFIARPPYRNALIVIGIAIAMASLFAVSYVLALARPTPHHIPAAMVGNPASRRGLLRALEAATHDGLDVRAYASLSRAERMIARQRVYCAFVLNGARPQLLVASAAGTSVARLLEHAAAEVPPSAGGPLRVVDPHPLPSNDPEGLASFYATLAATILGFVTMFQLRLNAPGLSLQAWLTCVAILAVLGGFVLAVIVNPGLGALRGPFLDLWAALAGQIAVAALFNSAMLALIGRWAIVPTWGLFIAIGNASSGGAVAPPLLPAFYRFVGRFLPNGATVETIRNAVYFRHDQQPAPIMVEAMWLVGALAALLLAGRLAGRKPGLD